MKAQILESGRCIFWGTIRQAEAMILEDPKNTITVAVMPVVDLDDEPRVVVLSNSSLPNVVLNKDENYLAAARRAWNKNLTCLGQPKFLSEDPEQTAFVVAKQKSGGGHELQIIFPMSLVAVKQRDFQLLVNEFSAFALSLTEQGLKGVADLPTRFAIQHILAQPYKGITVGGVYEFAAGPQFCGGSGAAMPLKPSLFGGQGAAAVPRMPTPRPGNPASDSE